jgi:hypothetical protein
MISAIVPTSFSINFSCRGWALLCQHLLFCIAADHHNQSVAVTSRARIWRRALVSSHLVTMTDKLPPQLLALFAPRPPLRWVPAPDFPSDERKTAAISGVAAFLPALQEYKQTDVYKASESWLQRRDRKRQEHEEEIKTKLEEGPKICSSFVPRSQPKFSC